MYQKLVDRIIKVSILAGASIFFVGVSLSMMPYQLTRIWGIFTMGVGIGCIFIGILVISDKNKIMIKEKQDADKA